ncbi:4-oxalocrotonate tautomerase [Halalkalibacter alkalisediminis]|uniref:4-oxalocrotonate tautomerase n=1 Tax=Halalkalibacter alkalisediminis TaxID=935616 RepID=A0ABV6NBU5_9BACI|nr:4-oxalocrotonate tautomerase [Halalkalibacter alkalisediminis]
MPSSRRLKLLNQKKVGFYLFLRSLKYRVLFQKKIERRTKMPIVNVNIMEGRPKDKIERVIADITETITNTLEVPRETVRVIVTEVPKSHWGIAGESVEKRNASK